MFSIYQTGGLALLNALARLGNYKYQEIDFGSAATEKIDWYQVDEKAPTVIFYYGGNWRSFRKEDYRFVADTLCGMGVNVAIPDFLKYPEHRFNGILKSVVSATNYFLEKVYTKGPVIIMGHSSGAQMAALVTLNSPRCWTPPKELRQWWACRVLTTFIPLLTATTGTFLVRKTNTLCPSRLTLCAVMRLNSICCTVQTIPAFGEAIQRV